jgi:hypothetical protein
MFVFSTARTPLDQPTWGPNLEEFRRRFDPEQTWGEGPKRLKNLYFTYLVELRALAKAAPYLEQVKLFVVTRMNLTIIDELFRSCTTLGMRRKTLKSNSWCKKSYKK